MTNAPMHFLVDRLDTPLGELMLVADADARLHRVVWAEEEADTRAALAAIHGEIELEPVSDPGGASSALRAYFDGDLHAIDTLEVAPVGTPFQLKVWAALREIAIGRTWSYGEMAHYIGHPQAFRAVGMACNANQISIVVPCHRVIGSGGALVGFGGGLQRKQWLLSHESGALSLPLF